MILMMLFFFSNKNLELSKQYMKLKLVNIHSLDEIEKFNLKHKFL